jgi:hypothetical protein
VDSASLVGAAARPALGRNARLLLGALLVSNVGNGMQTLAVGQLLYERTGSVAAFGAVIVAEYLVLFLTNALAGAWADRSDPARTLAVVDGVRALGVLLASLMLLGEDLLLASMLLLTVVVQVGKPFNKAARFVLEPALIPPGQLARYNGLSVSCIQLGQLLGIGLAGLVLSRWSAPLAIAFNGLSFLLASLACLLLPAVPRAELAAPRAGAWLAAIWQDWRDLLRYLRRAPGLPTLLAASAGDYLTPSFLNLFLVLLVALHFQGNPYGLSILDGCFAVGAMLGGLLVERAAARLDARTCALVGLGGQGLAFLLLALAGGAAPAALLTLCIGISTALSYSALTLTLQLRVRGGPYKGRVALARSLVAALFACIALPAAGWIAGHSLALALAAAGLVCLGFAALVFFSKVLPPCQP